LVAVALSYFGAYSKNRENLRRFLFDDDRYFMVDLQSVTWEEYKPTRKVAVILFCMLVIR